MSSEQWDAVAAEWRRSERDRLWRRHSDAVNRALLSRWRPPRRFRRLLKTDLFDEAVGEGLATCLKDLSRTAVGMDISTLTARAARSAGGASILVFAGDVRRLPLAGGSLDAVVSLSTLDHFRTWDELVASLVELRRVLKKGGQLLLTLDNRANPVVGLRNLLPFGLVRKLNVVPYYVGTTCGPGRLQRTLVRVGFEVLDLEAVMHCPRVVAVWLAKRFQDRASRPAQDALLRSLMAFEKLGRWPTRFLTGCFLAVRARRLPVDGPAPGTGRSAAVIGDRK